MTTLDPNPAEAPNGALSGSKNIFTSNAMWASIATFVVGQVANIGGLEWLASVTQANIENVIGTIMTIIGLFGAWATARRKTKLTL